jgi:outer membrane protein TolC
VPSPSPAQISPQTIEQLDRQFEDALKTKTIRPKNVLPLHLTDAARLLLVQNNDIRLSKDDSLIARASLLKATSAFDSSVVADVTYSRLYPPSSANAPITQQDITNILNTTLSSSLAALLQNPNADIGSLISNSVGKAQDQNRRKARDTYSASAGVTKKFRNGLEVSLTYKPDFQDTNSDGVWPPSEHIAQISISVPVLKFGVAVNATEEMAAERDYEGALLKLNHTVAQSLSKVVGDYWQSVSSIRKLENADSAYRVSSSLLDLTEELVKAAALAKTELSLAEAKKAEAASARSAALIDMFQATKQLALDLGLKENQLRVLPFAADPMPSLSASAVAKLNTDRLIDVALAHRFDRLSALKAIEAKRLTAYKARIDLRPDLLLDLAGGVMIDDEKYSMVAHQSGYTAKPNFSAVLGFTYAPANHQAKGGVVDAEAKLDQAIVNLDVVSESIAINIKTLGNTMADLVERIAKDDAASASFQQNVSDMREKFRQGAATLIETFQAVSNLIDARNSAVASRLTLAQAISQLRFETGTILTPSIVSWIRPYKRNLDSVQVTNASLTTLPTEWEVTSIPQQPIDPWNHERRKKYSDHGGTE